MDISDYIKPELIEIISGHHTKDEVLNQIAELVLRSTGPGVHSKTEILRKLRDREELGSTGFGNNIAIPHCALPNIDEFVIGIIIYPDGAEFEAMDSKPVKFLVFIIAPEKKKNQHIRFLSQVSGTLRQPGAMDDISSQLNSVAVRERFLKYALPAGKDKKQKEEYSMLRIFCQVEKKFHDIMDILSELKDRDISIIEGTDAKKFMKESAFFGKIWSDKSTKFHKILIVVLPTEKANDTIRKLDHIVGTLPERRGIMIIMQKIEFISGYLND
ncbi:MAG: PTS sugar transporter subunit IIA [Candidatus Delongbacteria bacterium]|jgi:PTS system nitrogen regulatory IIA component|nr:PTS sugar transporter subunit IIA [Candidatus Delongbacteria bacterium]MDD4206129.1 PTS sugar transporter subunit IIA [Candidatus Delongbacteria bacterium]MDY0017555.1 PTS sugar transporter subunit IIA [Candidatus Delongbacteria bacterium]